MFDGVCRCAGASQRVAPSKSGSSPDPTPPLPCHAVAHWLGTVLQRHTPALDAALSSSVRASRILLHRIRKAVADGLLPASSEGALDAVHHKLARAEALVQAAGAAADAMRFDEKQTIKARNDLYRTHTFQTLVAAFNFRLTDEDQAIMSNLLFLQGRDKHASSATKDPRAILRGLGIGPDEGDDDVDDDGVDDDDGGGDDDGEDGGDDEDHQSRRTKTLSKKKQGGGHKAAQSEAASSMAAGAATIDHDDDDDDDDDGDDDVDDDDDDDVDDDGGGGDDDDDGGKRKRKTKKLAAAFGVKLLGPRDFRVSTVIGTGQRGVPDFDLGCFGVCVRACARACVRACVCLGWRFCARLV